jgi:S1-C subfamily serine protease
MSLKKNKGKHVNLISIIGVTLVVMAVGSWLIPKHNDLVANSVKITNMTETSGGSGVILTSSPTESKILTNSHVCHVVENGGLVTSTKGSFLVTSYKKSQEHDLCIVTVNANLGQSTKLATEPPALYTEKATISGFPHLYPNIRTYGLFSGRRVIQVMTGMRGCNDDDMKDPNKALLCLLAGGIPEVKRYESILVSATIMPGSSGSGVYNSKGELAGLVFAGEGDLAYAWTVPYEAVANFVNNEQFYLQAQKPSPYVNLDSAQGESGNKNLEPAMLKKIREACKTSNAVKFKETCEIVNSDMIWTK